MIIGITGSFGSGKSTLLKVFAEAGFLVVSADAECHKLYLDSESAFCRALTGRWGNGILNEDGLIDRKKVAEKVFSSPEELAFLNGWIKPLIRELLEQKVLAARAQGRDLALEIPLLFEGNYQGLPDKTVALYTKPELRMERLAKRNFTREEICRRDALQMPAEEKLKLADYAVINNGSPEFLREQCLKLLKIFTESTQP